MKCIQSNHNILNCFQSNHNILNCVQSSQNIINCVQSNENIINCVQSNHDIINCIQSNHNILSCFQSNHNIINCVQSNHNIINCISTCFSEFVITLYLMTSAPKELKLRKLFLQIDEDGSGSLSVSEVVKVVKSAYDVLADLNRDYNKLGMDIFR